MPEAPTALNDWLRRKIATDPDDDLTAGNFDMGEPYEVTIYSDEAGCRVLYGRGIHAEGADEHLVFTQLAYQARRNR